MVSGELFGIDANEPSERVGNNSLKALAPVLPCAVQPLNANGYADYLWHGIEGLQQAERKTWAEVLGSMDHVQDQLRREKQAHPDIRLMLIIEGLVVPKRGGFALFVETTKGKRHLFYEGRSHFAAPVQKAYAWLYEVNKYMEVYYTPTFDATMQMLAAFYKADQKEEHTTFRRYFKEMDWHPNPQVQRLMNMGGNLGIGAIRAEALIRRFGTVYNVSTATPEMLASVEGVGHAVAVKFLRGVGRPDV